MRLSIKPWWKLCFGPLPKTNFNLKSLKLNCNYQFNITLHWFTLNIYLSLESNVNKYVVVFLSLMLIYNFYMKVQSLSNNNAKILLVYYIWVLLKFLWIQTKQYSSVVEYII